MADEAANVARQMKVAEAAVAKFDRQGVAEELVNLGFDPMAMARAVHQGSGRRCDPFPGRASESLIEREALPRTGDG